MERIVIYLRLSKEDDLNRDEPARWISFLRELFYEDEIPMVQEFLGYCLIPTTRAQKMLLVIGNGGEGKSRIGRVTCILPMYSGAWTMLKNHFQKRHSRRSSGRTPRNWA